MDSEKHSPLYEWLVLKALHTFRIERLSLDLPIIVEIVDTREKLESFLSLIDNEIEEGLATLEKAHIHFYRSGNRAEPGS